jgi:hypothetical protein
LAWTLTDTVAQAFWAFGIRKALLTRKTPFPEHRQNQHECQKDKDRL